MTNIVLLRHGQSEANVSRDFACLFDTPLSPLGRQQAEAVADYLVGRVPVTRIYASPLSRATDTARPTAERLGLSITPDAGLIEIDAGDWENKPSAELAEKDEMFRRWYTDLTAVTCPGGESVKELYDRVTETLLRLARKHDGETLLLASHWTPIAAMLAFARGAGFLGMREPIHIHNASLHFLRFEEDKLTLEHPFFTEHLTTATE